MDARIARLALVLCALVSTGASYRTRNFIVSTSSPEFAKEVGDEAERLRKELAVLWLGKPLADWNEPCPIEVHVGEHLGAGGATTFVFDKGRVFGWRMSIQGSATRVVDSVLPHEVTHTVFATHFRQPLPRWADEGACTTVEHQSERAKQQTMLVHFLKSNRGIAFSNMFAMKEYPRDMLPLYSQGYSLARFLIEQGGRRKFVKYVGDGMQRDDWVGATQRHYNFRGLAHLQNAWLDWVREGSPRLTLADAGTDDRQEDSIRLVSDRRRERPKTNLIHRESSAADPVASAEPHSDGTRSRSLAAGHDRVASVDHGGWRPSNLRRTANQSAPLDATNPFADTLVTDVSSSGARTQHAATRPQPMQSSDRQVILEWSREPKSAGVPADSNNGGAVRDARLIPEVGMTRLR